jgi:hypothetical protein
MIANFVMLSDGVTLREFTVTNGQPLRLIKDKSMSIL